MIFLETFWTDSFLYIWMMFWSTENSRNTKLMSMHLLESESYVKAWNCEFHLPSVSFLGYILVGGQVKAGPAKAQAVKEWPTPTSRKHIQRFLGFANFYRWFIRNYSPVASPLTCLTSTNVPLCLFFLSPHPCTEKLWCGRLLAVKPPWRSGETCWRQWSNHSPYGLLTRT